MKSGINAYKQGSIKNDLAAADPHRITAMLMQGVMDKSAITKGCIERGDLAAKAQHVTKINAILMSLRDTLDLDIGGEVAQNLFSLYNYMIERVSDASATNALEPLDEVIRLMAPIKQGWDAIPVEAREQAYQQQASQ